MDFSFCEAQSTELKSWEHKTICTLPRNVAEKRSKNKLKSWPNIRCRVGTEVWNDYENSETEEWGEGEKKINHALYVSTGIWKIAAVLEKCLLSYETALKWNIPEGKESHFVNMTLKRSQRSRKAWENLRTIKRQEVWREDQKEKKQSEPLFLISS